MQAARWPSAGEGKREAMSKNTPPERIYNWRESWLSIARLYGGLTFNGEPYVIAYGEEGQPLVRLDVIKREEKAKRAKAKAERAKRLQLQANFDLEGMK